MDALISELHEVIKADTPNEREYKRYTEGIKSSVLTAFYTPPQVVDAIVGAIWHTGIAPQHILDPSAGTGIFVQAAHAHDPHAEITCFEKDPATGLILKTPASRKPGAPTGLRAHRTQICRPLRRGRQQYTIRGRGTVRSVFSRPILIPCGVRAHARSTTTSS